MKRIVLGFDGTWNEPDDNTNVQRFCKSVKHDGRKQIAEYVEGVGTHVHDKISGGLLGKGISKNIKEGYRYLVQQYELGDEIFLVGFSRGAYTARSLVGLIRKVGLLSRPKIEAQRLDISDLDKGLLSDAYALYRRRDPNPDVEDVQAFRKQYSYYDASKEYTGEPLDTNPIKIKFLGVWDTVGALGIPIGVLSKVGYADEAVGSVQQRKTDHD